MKPSDIIPGRVYVQHDGGLERYVIAKGSGIPGAPAGDRRCFVTYRRPGAFATETTTILLTSFLRSVKRERPEAQADPAPHLPNNGMAVL